jgi:hypothetical protein
MIAGWLLIFNEPSTIIGSYAYCEDMMAIMMDRLN